MSLTLSDLLRPGAAAYERARTESHDMKPCVCERNLRARTGSTFVGAGSLISPVDLDPGCPWHRPWTIVVDEYLRRAATRLWFAGYQAGYGTSSASLLDALPAASVLDAVQELIAGAEDPSGLLAVAARGLELLQAVRDEEEGSSDE